MDKSVMLNAVKSYIEGALRTEMESDFGRGYNQGLRSLQGFIELLEDRPVLRELLPKKIALH